MQTTILRDATEIRALENSWRAREAPSPFHEWSFLESWLGRGDRREKPFLVLVTEDDDWVAIALWCIEYDGLGIRRLTGLGGEDAWYHDPWLLKPEKEAAVAEALALALREARRDWDMVKLILREDQSGSLLRHLESSGLAYSERVDWRQHQTAALGESWTVYWDERPKQLRELVRRRGKKLAALPHRFLEADALSLDRLLEDLFRLHLNRWHAERDWSAYYQQIRAIATDASERGTLCFYALEVEGTIIATELLLRSGTRSFELMRIIDPSPIYGALSGGSLLTAWALERMHRAGIREIDMGPGHHEWKSGLETHRTGTILKVVAQPRHLPAVAWVAWEGTFKPVLKEIPWVRRLKATLSGTRKHEAHVIPAT